jgi:DNA helicase II / ATP-dependent DNA helicase PcrA
MMHPRGQRRYEQNVWYAVWYNLTMHHLDSLNSEQKRAALATEGPVLIVAGAGAGKTKTISHRILHLMHLGVSPQQILAITFTNKAAKEMRERVRDMIRADADLAHLSRSMPFMSTFHSLGVQIIKENAELLRLPRHFSIFDTSDSKKALKDALQKLGLEPKEHLDKVRHIISHEKGRGNDLADYLARESYDYTSEMTKKAWRYYQETLSREHALDFDDLLLKTLKLLQKNRDVLEKYQDRFRYIHIDEYQDTNGVQNAIVDLIAGKHKNICVVGDTDQCLAQGTEVTMEDGDIKPIEKIKVGERVLSNYGSGDFRPATVTRVTRTETEGILVRIETKKGRVLESTPEHIHFAGYRLGSTPQLYINYLMHKKGFGWRIGTTSIYTNGQKKSIAGFIQRSIQEHADATWVIGTHETPNQARIQEYILSLQYQIPTIPFTARKGLSVQGYVHDAEALKEIFSSFDTETSALRLLSDKGLSRDYPHHQPQAHNSNRRNINITLCGDRRGKNPMHILTMSGNDEEGKRKLVALGFSVRPERHHDRNWRCGTVRADYGETSALAFKMASVFPEANLVWSARLGENKTGTRDTNSLPHLPASSVMPGMALFTADGYDIVSTVSRVPVSQSSVFDLDIEKTHNFIANGIVTHNCIYSWRGAEIKNMLHFEKTYPDVQTIFLEQNYRSTKTILAAANEIIQKNTYRIPKKLFTENQNGEKIGVFEGRNETDEAHFIALKCKSLIESGVPSDHIAVLYRANFQSRVLEDAFLSYGVPYDMLGTKFFERKEIKDVLSFVRVALNPDNLSDMARIINIPPRGIGKVTLQKILDGTRAKIENFRGMLARFRTVLVSEKPSDALKRIIRESGMETMYKTGLEEDIERLENIMELVTLASQYDEYPAEEGIEKFLTDASLASDQDALEEGASGVKLMTVHSSKGLEFEYVFVAGMEADLFPHKRIGQAKKSGEEAEEERRLFYVAVTRAGKKLFLTHAQTRTIFGSMQVNSPSEFLDDIPGEHTERESYSGASSRAPLFSIDF